MRKFESEEKSYYEDYKREFQVFWDAVVKHSKGINDSKGFENSYLYHRVDLQYDEHDRLCVLLPLIKIEIEQNMLSNEMLEELEIYYADFNDGILNDVLYEHEYEEIKSDLYWCYENK